MLPQSVLKVNGQTVAEHEPSFCTLQSEVGTSSSNQGVSFYLCIWKMEFCLLIAALDYSNQAHTGKRVIQ